MKKICDPNQGLAWFTPGQSSVFCLFFLILNKYFKVLKLNCLHIVRKSWKLWTFTVTSSGPLFSNVLSLYRRSHPNSNFSQNLKGSSCQIRMAWILYGRIGAGATYLRFKKKSNYSAHRENTFINEKKHEILPSVFLFWTLYPYISS